MLKNDILNTYRSDAEGKTKTRIREWQLSVHPLKRRDPRNLKRTKKLPNYGKKCGVNWQAKNPAKRYTLHKLNQLGLVENWWIPNAS